MDWERPIERVLEARPVTSEVRNTIFIFVEKEISLQEGMFLSRLVFN